MMVPFGPTLPGGLRQHNGRLPYTADNGRKLQADNHMTSWNAAARPGGHAERDGKIGQASQKWPD